MSPLDWRNFVCAFLILTISWGWNCAVAQELAQEQDIRKKDVPQKAIVGSPLDLTEFEKLATEAKTKFQTIEASHLKEAENSLKKSMGRLEKYLLSGGNNGKAWLRFLLWDDLQKQLADPAKADLGTLRKVSRRFRSGNVGLELEVFSQVADRLEAYLQTLAAFRRKNLRGEFETHLASLIAEIGKSKESEEFDEWRPLVAEIAWLESHRQAPEVVAAARRRFSQPNFVASFSAKFIGDASEQPIADQAPVRDSILGTSIRGQGYTTGVSRLRVVPHAERAVFETEISAINCSKTVGTNGPAVICAEGATQLEARKQILVDALGIRSRPANATAHVNTRITGFGAKPRGLIGRIVKRVARRKAPQQKAQSERIAARHAERQFLQRVENQAAGSLGIANRTYFQRFRNPLLRRGEFPRLLRFATRKDALAITAVCDGRGRLAAPIAPPESQPDADFALKMHESLVNNLAHGLLGGKTLRREDMDRAVREVVGDLPARLAAPANQKPWSISFASRDPLSLRVRKQELEIVFRARGFTSGERVLDGMDVTIRYRVERNGPGLTATRVGEPEVLPPDYVAGSGAPIPLRLNSLRNLLKTEFGRIFPEEITTKGLAPPGRLATLGRLELAQLEADRGWLALAWKRTDARSNPRPTASAHEGVTSVIEVSTR